MVRHARPFLKWAGGKSQLLPQYDRFFPSEFRTYHEPFLGSGAVFFHLKSKGRITKAYLSDSNEELIGCCEVIRDHLPELLTLLKQHQKRHGQDYYYRVRERVPRNPIKHAARLIYLNKTCYNGLYRLNSEGKFNVPMGRYNDPRILNESLLTSASLLLQDSVLKREDFAVVLTHARRGDFVYFDPPYYPLSRTSNFTAYTAQTFLEEEQRKLRDVVVTLTERDVFVMLSNSDTEFIRHLYEGIPDVRLQAVRARRAINTDPRKRGPVSELVITNYPPPSTPS